MLFSPLYPQQTYYKPRETIVGRFPQVVGFVEPYEEELATSIYNTQYNELPNFIPHLPPMKVHAHTKITDVVSSPLGGNNWLVSEKMKAILETFKLPKHAFYPLTLVQREQNYPYYYFKIETKTLQYLNFKKSYFITKKLHNQEESLPFQAKNREELYKISKACVLDRESKQLIGQQLVFDQHLLEWDIFNLDFLGGWHIVPALMKKLQEQAVTGLEYSSVNYGIDYGFWENWKRRK